MTDFQKQYAMVSGSEFASGFLYGVKMGGFNHVKLFECLKNEPGADEIFWNSEIELRKGLKENNLNEIAKAFVKTIEFIMAMALEKNGS